MEVLEAAQRYLWGLHILGVVFGLGAATVTDVMFFKFLHNFRIVPREQELMATLSKIVWIGITLLLVSGVLLFLPRAEVFFASDRFLMKMTAVAVIIANGIVLNLWIQPRARRISFVEAGEHHVEEEELRERERVRRIAFSLGGISFISWYTAFALAILNMIAVAYVWLLLIFLVAILLAVAGALVQERRIERKAEEILADEQHAN
ncbi:MAG: hypothetical protein ACNA8W_05300 [Bradymonadaceae bacterium]